MSAELGQAIDVVRLERPDDMEGWRAAARACLAAGVPPDALVWEVGSGTADLFAPVGSVGAPEADGADDTDEAGGSDRAIGGARADGADTVGGVNGASGVDGTDEAGEVDRTDGAGAAVGADEAAGVTAPPPRVPRAFLELAERVVCHRDPDRFALLYRVLWRFAHGEPGLLARASDPDVHRLDRLGRAVARERHKMHAFVRFRRTPGVEPEHFGAWFEPEHRTLRLASDFFVRRFATMRWSIVTPEESAHWDTRALVFGPGGTRGQLPESEAMEALWRTYFGSIFNPARLKPDAMRAEMPVKYWKNLPEAPMIAELVRTAGRRAEAMIAAAPTVPPRFAARATHPPAHPEPAAVDLTIGDSATGALDSRRSVDES